MERKGDRKKRRSRTVPRPGQIFIKIKKEEDVLRADAENERKVKDIEREEKKRRESSRRDFSR